MRGGINLETIAVAGHGISALDGAVHAVLDNFAVESVRAGWVMTIAIADEDVTVNYGTRIGRAGALGSRRKNAQSIGRRGLLRENGNGKGGREHERRQGGERRG
jgi:hypothetical protein